MGALVFRTEGRAKFADLDPHGHVNTQHYLSYFLQHRFDGMREHLGLDLMTLARLPVTFFVRTVSIVFLRPLRGDQLFSIISSVSRWGDTSCTVACEMKDASDQLLSTCSFEFVCIDRKTFQPASWPEELKRMAEE
jgi:acyl-CoA thioester hydrolase